MLSCCAMETNVLVDFIVYVKICLLALLAGYFYIFNVHNN